MRLRRRSYDPGAHLLDSSGQDHWQAGGVCAIYPIQTEPVLLAKLQCDIERNTVASGNIVVPLRCTDLDCGSEGLLRLKTERDARDLEAFSYRLLSFEIRLHFHMGSVGKIHSNTSRNSVIPLTPWAAARSENRRSETGLCQAVVPRTFGSVRKKLRPRGSVPKLTLEFCQKGCG